MFLEASSIWRFRILVQLPLQLPQVAHRETELVSEGRDGAIGLPPKTSRAEIGRGRKNERVESGSAQKQQHQQLHISDAFSENFDAILQDMRSLVKIRCVRTVQREVFPLPVTPRQRDGNRQHRQGYRDQ